MSEILWASDGLALREDTRPSLSEYKAQILAELAQPKAKPRYKDLVGMKFNRLTVLAFDGRYEYTNSKGEPKSHTTWKCRCDCGRIVRGIVGTAMKRGNTKSCGCLSIEILRSPERREKARSGGRQRDKRVLNQIGVHARAEIKRLRIEAAFKLKVGDKVWYGGAVRTVLEVTQHRLKLDQSTKKIVCVWREHRSVWPLMPDYKLPPRIAQLVREWRAEHGDF